MTTPVTDNTAWSIISGAVWNACLLPEGEDPDSEMMAKYTRRLNQLIIHIITGEGGDGVRLWLWQDTAITLVAGQNKYKLGPVAFGGNVSNVLLKPANIRDQYYLYSASNGSTRRPVFRISRQEYDMLSTPGQQGPVTQIFCDPQQNTFNITTWLIPDVNEATGTLQLVLLNQVTTFAGVTDSMNFPVEWALALEWGLSSEICHGQPQAVINRCDAKAAYYLTKLQEWDSEQGTSILPQPDQRLILPSRFRP